MDKKTYSFGSKYYFRFTLALMFQLFIIIISGVHFPYIYLHLSFLLLLVYALLYAKYKKEVLILEGNYIYKYNPIMIRKSIFLDDYKDFKLEPSFNSYKITAYNQKLGIKSRILIDEFASPIEEIYENIISKNKRIS